MGEHNFSEGNYAVALKLHSQALKIRQTVLGKNHIDVATTLGNIANCYHSDGKYDEALKLHNEALKIRKNALGGEHPDVATSLSNIAKCYYSKVFEDSFFVDEKFEKALKLHQQALEIRKKALG